MWDRDDRTWEDIDYGPKATGYGVGTSVQDGFAERKLGRAGGQPEGVDP